MRFFESIGRSWEFSKISYRIVWDHKNLLIFPILSTVAAALVIASFVLPLWGTGTLQQWSQMLESDPSAASRDPMMWVLLFLFYFCNYFVIVFFNSALTACAMRVVSGEAPTVGYGLSMAAQRLPQILGWALVSAIIGVLLKLIENAHEKAGQFIAAIMGSAWTALTYFVVPVIVMEGAGPVASVKRSVTTLRSTWGTALVGNFSMGFLGFLVMLPFLLAAGVLIFGAIASQSLPLIVLGVGLGVLLIVIGAAATGAADVIFKAVLYNYATGRMIPEGIDTSRFDEAFRSRG